MQFRPFYCTQLQLNMNTATIAQAGRLIICTDSKSIYFCPSNGTANLIGKASDASTSEAGLMTPAMVNKLNGIAEQATKNTASDTLPKVAGTATKGSETNYARGDHVHPLQTSVSGNAGTATKLAEARTITLSDAVTGSIDFDGSANKTIITTLSNFDASKITSGIIDINRLPHGALERCVVVANQTERFALTKDRVQTGDTVKQTDTNTMYFVVDDTKLNQEAGYEIYTAGHATTANTANTANQLTTAQTLNIQDADGSNTGTGAAFNGTKGVTIKLPSTIKANLTGNASTATKATQDSAGQQINTTYIKNLSVNGTTITYTKGDDKTTGSIITQDTTYSTMTGATGSSKGISGLVPAPAAGAQNSFLKGDGTWATPVNTTYNIMVGASGSTNGSSGLVPAPAAGSQTKFLRGDGTWAITPDTDTTYSAGEGLSLSGTIFSLSPSNVIAGTKGPTADVTGTNNTTIKVPKVTVDTYGRVTGLTEYTYTSKDTTYNIMTKATPSANGSAGLVPAPSKGMQASFLRGDGTWAVPTDTTYSAGDGLTLNGTTFNLNLQWETV